MNNELIVIWSEFAETQLDLIYEYYLLNANKKVASKLVRGIILAPKKLITKPYIGQTRITQRKTNGIPLFSSQALQIDLFR